MKRDDEYIQKTVSRLQGAYGRLGTWRAVGKELGVNHGILVGLVRHGNKVPKDAEIRARLGLPRVMPSERKPRVKKVMPMLGTAAWMEMVLKKIKPTRRYR